MKNQRRTRPSQIGCAEIPISTKMTAARSKSERGRSAERMPSGIAISIQTTIPPKISDSVTGAARMTRSVTGSRFATELPRSRSVTNRQTNRAQSS